MHPPCERADADPDAGSVATRLRCKELEQTQRSAQAAEEEAEARSRSKSKSRWSSTDVGELEERMSELQDQLAGAQQVVEQVEGMEKEVLRARAARDELELRLAEVLG